MSDLIFDICLSKKRREEFEYIQQHAWQTAIKLEPAAAICGFNINSTFQCELYTEFGFLEATNLTWTNFIKLFPEYLDFCKKYNFYPGCTMISRNIFLPHRHGSGQYTVTYPFKKCNDIKVSMITPTIVVADDKYELSENETYQIDYQYSCSTGQPFLLKANHFHMTSGKEFVNGSTIFTVWHALSAFTKNDVEKLLALLKYDE